MFARNVVQPQVTARTASQRPGVVASKAGAENILVGPLLLPRKQSTTISEAMRTILPVYVSSFQGNTTPRSVGNPVLNFPVFFRESGGQVGIFADDSTNQPAYFDFFRDKNWEIEYGQLFPA